MLENWLRRVRYLAISVTRKLLPLTLPVIFVDTISSDRKPSCSTVDAKHKQKEKQIPQTEKVNATQIAKACK